MTLAHLLTYAAACWGLTSIVTESALFTPVRAMFPKTSSISLGALLRCPQCFGFWTGLLLHLAGFGLFTSSWPALGWAHAVIGAVLDGCASSAICDGARAVVARLER